ncbi:MAG TPA: DUF433 domain-containing protein [Tepidisphaeraceae bacterium]|nr:DUF433 domain-containing protein [Tepidisphaeraceae bacterium]
MIDIYRYNLEMNPISVNPKIMSGTPCFSGTRVPVKGLFDWLADDYTIDEFLENFPSVTREQVQAVLDLASEKLLGIPAGTR